MKDGIPEVGDLMEIDGVQIKCLPQFPDAYSRPRNPQHGPYRHCQGCMFHGPKLDEIREGCFLATDKSRGCEQNNIIFVLLDQVNAHRAAIIAAKLVM